jgi:tetratricopeptide (TPR) repeat protein
MPMTYHEAFTALVNALVTFYDREDSIRTIVIQTGLSMGHIAFSSRAIETWTSVLFEASQQNKAEDIISIAQQAYPVEPNLQAAVAAYREAVARGDWSAAPVRRGDFYAYESLPPNLVTRPALKITAPPDPVRPPSTADFIGRQAELADFAHRLAGQHLVVIAGMPGIGKTALAARLAEQVASSSNKIFWHQFHEGEGIETIIWRLAGMLWRHGQAALWELLEGARQSGGQPPPAEVLLDYLVQLMRGQNYVLCLDDFHHAEEDPLVEKTVDRLQTLLAAGEIKLIVTSRRMPATFRTLSFARLGGLSRADATDLLAARKATLAPDLLAELHQSTDGNAELLILAAHALQRSRQPAQVVKRLANEEDIETFLLREVDKGLADDEKQVLSGVAVLLGYPGTRDAIEATLASGSLKRTLRYLANRFLLREQEGRLDHEYVAHAIVQAFYYELLSRKERQELHRRAGEYYERKEPDRVRAAMHYQRAGDSPRAVELATADIWAAINQGQARLLRSLLVQLSQKRLDARSSGRVQLALGEVLAFLGESQPARAAYETALANIEAEAPAAAVDLEARAYLGLGTLLANQDPEEALSWIERGLSLASTAQPERLAALHNRHGALLVGQAKYDEAIAALDQALALLSGVASQLRANVLTNLGAAHAWAGDMAWGREYTRQALALNRQLHDQYGLLGILSNTGIDKEIAGDWTGAAADYGEALRLAEQLGSLAEQARIHNLLGTLRLHQGDDVAAEDHLQRAITLFRQIDNPEYLAATLPVLAQLRLGQLERDAARAALAEAEALAREGGWDYILPETFTTQASLALVENDLTQAQDRADRAIALAAALGQHAEEGKAWRAKGQVLMAAGQEIEAQAAFERSRALLANHDLYETARTQAQWGLALLANSDPNRSAALLREARATFEHLGARRDLAQVGQPFRPGF